MTGGLALCHTCETPELNPTMSPLEQRLYAQGQ